MFLGDGSHMVHYMFLLLFMFIEKADTVMRAPFEDTMGAADLEAQRVLMDQLKPQMNWFVAARQQHANNHSEEPNRSARPYAAVCLMTGVHLRPRQQVSNFSTPCFLSFLLLLGVSHQYPI